jgi:hypothetical protein
LRSDFETFLLLGGFSEFVFFLFVICDSEEWVERVCVIVVVNIVAVIFKAGDVEEGAVQEFEL